MNREKTPSRRRRRVMSAAAVALSPAALAAALASSCAPEPPRIAIVSYNVHDLFDGSDCGREYPEYSVEEGTWSPALYAERLGLSIEALRLASASAGAGEAPDAVALQEIEDGGVARAIADALGEGYRSLAAPAPDSATTVALVTRLSIASARTHAVALPSGSPSRPILEVELETASGPLVVFVNHWKSRREGLAETEGDRIAQALALRSAIEARAAESPGVPVIACGDFNEDPEDFSPGDPPHPVALAVRGVRTGTKRGAIEVGPDAEGPASLASPWLMPSPAAEGSYAYRGAWERIDAFYLNAPLLDSRGLEVLSFRVPLDGRLLDADGFPRVWSPRDRGGYSDHLPVVLLLRPLPPPGPGVQ